MKNVFKQVAASIALLAFTPIALAQETTPIIDTDEAIAADGMADKVAVATSGAPLERPGETAISRTVGNDVNIAPPTLQIATTTENSTATIGVSIQNNSATPSAGGFSTRTSLFTIKASAPIKKGASETSAFSFSDFSAGESLSASFTQFTGSIGDFRGAKAIEDKVLRVCTAQASEAWFKQELVARSADIADLRKAQQAFSSIVAVALSQNAAMNIIKQRTDKKGGDIKKIGVFAFHKCAVFGDGRTEFKDMESLIAKYSGDIDRSNYVEAALGNENFQFWGLDASVGRKNISFLDLANFTSVNAEGTTYEVGLYKGLADRAGNWSARARIARSRSYKPQSSIEVCQPINGGPQLQCLSGPNGRAKEVSSFQVSGEFRTLFTVGSGSGAFNAAVAPLITYDIDENEFALDVPLYLAPRKDGALNGGVRIGYRSDKDEIGIGLFVGVPFSVFY